MTFDFGLRHLSGASGAEQGGSKTGMASCSAFTLGSITPVNLVCVSS